VLFDEFMRSRADQLLTTVNVLAADYGFKTGRCDRRPVDDPFGAA